MFFNFGTTPGSFVYLKQVGILPLWNIDDLFKYNISLMNRWTNWNGKWQGIFDGNFEREKSNKGCGIQTLNLPTHSNFSIQLTSLCHRSVAILWFNHGLGLYVAATNVWGTVCQEWLPATMFRPQPEQPRVRTSKRVGVQLLHSQPRATETTDFF